jgi:hypothetical protein
MPAADAQALAANLAAGEAHDCARFYGKMMATRAAHFCRNVGTKVGSMNTPHGGAARMVCGCCDARVTAGWFIPKKHKEPKANEAIKRIQRRRARRIKDQEFFIMDQSFKESRPNGEILPRVEGEELERTRSLRKRTRSAKAQEAMETEASIKNLKYGDWTRDQLEEEAEARGLRQTRRGRPSTINLLVMDDLDQAMKDRYRPRNIGT